jgi:6-phosphogluconolactonase
VLVANYTSGNIAMFLVEISGKLGPAVQVIQESGSSVNPERQEGPHAHCFLPDPGNACAIEANLGIDKLLVYRMDLKQGRLEKHAEILAHPGAGPRHLTFHPNGQYLYLINELDNTLTSYHYQSGSLEELQTVSTLPAGFNGKNSCADVHVTPGGKFLYGSNRGHDSIVYFEIDEGTGALSYRNHTSSGGQEPRNFVIDPSGDFLLVANQKSNNIATFKIDPETGSLINTGYETNISMPVCLKFALLNS